MIDQMHRASCLHLLMAAIAAWNTIYLTEVFATLRRRGEEISETTIAHFAPQPGRSLDNLRPLRLDLPNAGEEAAAS